MFFTSIQTRHPQEFSLTFPHLESFSGNTILAYLFIKEDKCEERLEKEAFKDGAFKSKRLYKKLGNENGIETNFYLSRINAEKQKTVCRCQLRLILC